MSSSMDSNDLVSGTTAGSAGPRTRSTPTGGRALPDLPRGEHYHPPRDREQGRAVAQGLGWFSIALGVTQLVVPDTIAELCGMVPNSRARTAMRMVGARELTAGMGLISRRTPAPWLWSRVAGDMMDIALITTSVGRRAEDRQNAARALLAVAGVAAVDVIATTAQARDASRRTAQRMQASAAGDGDRDGQYMGTDAWEATTRRAVTPTTEPAGGMHIARATVTINRTADELYAFWSNFENLPRFMKHLESVTVLGDRRTHWRTKGPGGTPIEWNAETVEDIPGQRISWRSVKGSDVANAGTVRFVQLAAGRGTEVQVELEYAPPGGALGNVVAKLFRADPKTQLQDDLRAFKQVMETGEILVARPEDREA